MTPLVYAVFRVYGNYSNRPYFQLISITDSIDTAKLFINKDPGDWPMYRNNCTYRFGVHSDMNEENNYTFIGKRGEIDSYCTYGDFGGYVIEEMKFLSKRDV